MTLVEPGIGLSHTVKMIETETDDPELLYLQKVKYEITNKSKGYILDED